MQNLTCYELQWDEAFVLEVEEDAVHTAELFIDLMRGSATGKHTLQGVVKFSGSDFEDLMNNFEGFQREIIFDIKSPGETPSLFRLLLFLLHHPPTLQTSVRMLSCVLSVSLTRPRKKCCLALRACIYPKTNHFPGRHRRWFHYPST